MVTKNLCFTLIVSAGLVAVASAAPQFSNEASTTMTGVQDSSNLFGAETGYGFQVNTSSTDPAYYINSINLVPGSGFNSSLNFNIGNQLGNGFAPNDYTLGTALGQGQTYFWSNVVDHQGAFDSSIATGIYNFDVQFIGGTSSTATDTLFDAQLSVEIINKLDVTVTPSYDSQSILQGGTSTVSSTLTNNMTDRSFVSTTWFITALSQGNDNLNGNFVGDWFNQTIAPGQSRTDMHSTWTAASDQALGTYTGTTGIVGGLYNGDQMYIGGNPNTAVTVVPEPGSVMALGAGLVMLLRRRRSR